MIVLSILYWKQICLNLGKLYANFIFIFKSKIKADFYNTKLMLKSVFAKHLLHNNIFKSDEHTCTWIKNALRTTSLMITGRIKLGIPCKPFLGRLQQVTKYRQNKTIMECRVTAQRFLKVFDQKYRSSSSPLVVILETRLSTSLVQTRVSFIKHGSSSTAIHFPRYKLPLLKWANNSQVLLGYLCQLLNDACSQRKWLIEKNTIMILNVTNTPIVS